VLISGRSVPWIVERKSIILVVAWYKLQPDIVIFLEIGWCLCFPGCHLTPLYPAAAAKPRISVRLSGAANTVRKIKEA
jgi:hypothetical protein